MPAVNRTPIEQTFFSQSVLVSNVTPTPFANNLTITSLMQTIFICNPSSNTNSVFFGDNNVSTTQGQEIVAGTGPIAIIIQQGRQLYELQDPEMITAQATACQPMDPTSIPLVVWNPSNMFLIAATAPTTVALLFFRNVYT